jgi:hypothetical protein
MSVPTATAASTAPGTALKSKFTVIVTEVVGGQYSVGEVVSLASASSTASI